MTILITGANSGFGLLATERFAQAGYHVAAGYRSRARADKLFELASTGLPIAPIELDVTNPTHIASAAQAITDISALVNNAGFGVRGPMEAISDATYQSQFDTNVLGVIRMVRAFAPQMRARGQGSIVNLSSLAGVITLPFSGIYAASKHAVEAISEAMYMEMRSFGIRVSLVEPGIFPTGFSAGMVTEPAFDAASPYARLGQAYGAAISAWIADSAHQPPSLVADAIFRAVTDPTTPFRQLVGPDAHRLAPAYRAAVDFEKFAGDMLEPFGMADALRLPST
jgi:NAD(P)-dependent dehydrogenase (short-subunit alcohol dehydrogenase family)